MSEVIVKGKSLIKKIDKTDPEYTGEGGTTKYIPLVGELVCVTDGDNAGLVVGDGTATVDNCKSVGGGDSFTPITVQINAINDTERIAVEVEGLPDDYSNLVGRTAYITNPSLSVWLNDEILEYELLPSAQLVTMQDSNLTIGFISENQDGVVERSAVSFSGTGGATATIGIEEINWNGADVEQFMPQNLFNIIIY